MPVTVQIDGVGNVQMDDSFKGLSPQQQQATVDEIANKHAATQQPSFMDRVVASPIGRALHDIPGQMLEGAALLVPSIPGTGASALMKSEIGKTEGAYEGALARNRNTPGYAAARQAADAATAQRTAMPGPLGLPTLGSRVQDQVTAPFNPTMASLTALVGSGGDLDAANAAADAQAASQRDFAIKNPVTSVAANFVGGLAANPEGAISNAANAVRPAGGTVPTLDELRQQARDAYGRVDNSGVTVSNDAMNDMADKLQDKIGARLDPTLHPDATAAFNRVAQYATDGAKGDRAATFSDLDNLRRVVADATMSTKPADKYMARQIMDHIDDFVDNLKPSDLDTSALDQARADLMSATGQKGTLASRIKNIEQNKPGALAARGAAGANTRAAYLDLMNNQLPAAEQARQAALGNFQAEQSLIDQGPQDTINALNEARGAWSKYKQASLIQQQIDKAALKAQAYSQSGQENALRAQFRQLALNDRAMSRLSPEVQQAVKDVAAGSPVGNVLRAIGKYAPHGPVATGAGLSVGYMLGGAEGGGLGAMAVPMVGEVARAGATAMTRNAAQRALNMALTGGNLPKLAATQAGVLRLPQITSATRLPLGMLATLPQLVTAN